MLILGTGVDVNSIEKINKKVVVTFELEIEKVLREKKINAIYFHRQAQSEKVWNEIRKTARTWWSTWPNKPINEGKSILEILRFEDTSLWWFVRNILWENKNGVFDTIYQIETLMSLIENFNPKIIEIHGKFNFSIIEMLNSLKKKYDFKISYSDSFALQKDDNHGSTLQKGNILTKKRIEFLLKLIILKIFHMFASKKNKKIAIFSFHVDELNKTGKANLIAADQYFIGLKDFVENNKKIINLVSLNKDLVSNKFNELLKNTLKGKYEPWVIYYSLKGLRNAYKVSKNFKKLFLKMEKNSNFIESMSIKGVNFYPFLRHLFVGDLPFLLGFSHLELGAADRFFKKNNPHVVFTFDGFNVVGSALNYVCNKNKKRVITPQMGTIYAVDSVNTVFSISEGFDLRLLPEIFCWGRHFSELIEINGYPKESIKQVGFWRTEIENEIKKIDDYIFYIAGANRIKLEYMLSVNEEIFTIRRICEVLPNGIKLVVKLHPSHDEKPYFDALSGLENIVLIGNKETIDVNNLIRHSKLVIGKVSTLIIQAMIFNKPVIIVNFAGEVNFLEIKKIPFVTNINEFSKVMNDILQGKATNQYKINDYCYPIGEKAVSNIIKELMKS